MTASNTLQEDIKYKYIRTKKIDFTLKDFITVGMEAVVSERRSSIWQKVTVVKVNKHSIVVTYDKDLNNKSPYKFKVGTVGDIVYSSSSSYFDSRFISFDRGLWNNVTSLKEESDELMESIMNQLSSLGRDINMRDINEMKRLKAQLSK